MSFTGNRFLVTEKSLELNITHELMSSLGVGAIGFNTQQEKIVGADVWLPLRVPLIFQFKRPWEGTDFNDAEFEINNNKHNTQHPVLDVLSRSNLCDAYYVFPLIIHNREFVLSFGVLSDNSVYVPPSWITDSVNPRPRNWMRTPHEVTVLSSRNFTVASANKGSGQGLSKEQLLERIKERVLHDRTKKPQLADQHSEPEDNTLNHIEESIRKMETTIRESDIMTRTEHTLTYILESKSRATRSYLSIPVQL